MRIAATPGASIIAALTPRAPPILIEVKRSTHIRIRRDVLGQLLDYAADGARY